MRVSEALRLRRLPPAAKLEIQRDRLGLGFQDPGIEKTVEASMAWLCRAQDNSTSADGGVARVYSYVNGWGSSYPETTGYIIPTFLEYARRYDDDKMRVRAQRMLQWLRKIQLPSGAFQGGEITSRPVVPVAFNTGQILLGLASGEVAFGGYREALARAADWLVGIQDPDGCWRQYSSPFAGTGEKTYDTHSAWGLLETARVLPDRGYAEAALANVKWALTHQRADGWIDKCCLDYAVQPLTHTLGYALRGVIEAYRFSHDARFLDAARKTADGILRAMREDGFLPGRLAPGWSGAVEWACLTGTAQIAICWFMLFQDTGDTRYRDAALQANRFVRRTVSFVDGDTAGAVKGCFPIDGEYGKYEFPNWGAKFLIDSLLLESDICKNAPLPATKPDRST